MNTAEVIQALGDTPRRITVKCPADHFIADVTVCVIDGELTLRAERSKRDLRRRHAQGKGDFGAHVHVSADRPTAPVCRSSHCDYRGARNEMELALELAQAALRGHAVHRLTS